MTKLASTLLAACVSASALAAQARLADTAYVIDSSAVQAAIDLGLQAKRSTDMGYKYEIKQMALGVRGMWGETINVTARAPLARIAAAASEAAHRYVPFTVDSVTPAMRAPVLEVIAQPEEPFGVPSQPVSSVRHIVLQTRDRETTVQPASVDTLVREWTSSGNVQHLKGLRVLFPLSAIPADEFDIVVLLSDEREHRQHVRAKERGRMLTGQ